MNFDDDRSSGPARRDFLRKTLTVIPVVTIAGTGVGGTVLASAPAISPEAVAAEIPKSTRSYSPTFFTPEEWAFVNAAVAIFIPTDGMGFGAADVGVPEFIDRQLNTRYGSGGLWYMQGPFHPDAPPELGYQLKLSPQEIYRIGIKEADAWCSYKWGQPFVKLEATQQQEALAEMDSGKVKFGEVPAVTFLNLLWLNTREGFFSDPIHGGNQGLAGWQLIGFPGARADFMDWVERNERYPFPPVSISGERG
ncbi:TPA: gluconate 2-dehydrogenase subunit 3 family protein [Pseudomonas aeruginosa]